VTIVADATGLCVFGVEFVITVVAVRNVLGTLSIVVMIKSIILIVSWGFVVDGVFLDVRIVVSLVVS